MFKDAWSFEKRRSEGQISTGQKNEFWDLKGRGDQGDEQMEGKIVCL